MGRESWSGKQEKKRDIFLLVHDSDVTIESFHANFPVHKKVQQLELAKAALCVHLLLQVNL